MPAHADRIVVNSRMYPPVVAKLDALCAHLSKERGRPVYRTEVINELVVRRFGELPASARTVDLFPTNGKPKPKRAKKRPKKRKKTKRPAK